MQDDMLRPESRHRFNIKREESNPALKKPLALPPIPTEKDLKLPSVPPLPTPSAGKASLEVSSLLINAETLIQHGEKSTAAVLCMQALSMNPQNAEALKKMIRILQDSRRADELVRLQEELAKVEPSFVTLVGLADTYYKMNKDEMALDTYFQALNFATEKSVVLFEVYKNIGNIFVKTADYDAAEEFYNKAHTLNPQSDILAVNLGTLEIQRNDLNSALERFRTALSVNAKNDKAWVGLALVHNQMGDQVLAYANIENAIDINPKNKTAVHLLANWSVRDQKYESAVQALENYLSHVEFDEDMSLILIHLFCLSGRLDLALLEIERVLLWNPNNTEVAQLEQKIKKNEGIS